MRPTLSNRILGYLTVYIVWGTSYYAILVGIRTVPPFLLAGVRFLVAGTLLLALGCYRNGRVEVNWKRAILLGTLFFACGNGVVTWSEQHVPSGTVALLVATIPLWVAALEWWRGERARSVGVVGAGLALGLLGIAVLTAPGGSKLGGLSLLHALIVMAGAFGWANGTVLSRRLRVSDSLFVSAGAEMLAGGVILGTIGLARGDRVDYSAFTRPTLLALAYLVVFASILAFSAFVWLLDHDEPWRVASYAYVNPLVAVAVGWALAGEAITMRTIVASAIIVVAVAMVVLSGRQRPVESTEAATPILVADPSRATPE